MSKPLLVGITGGIGAGKTLTTKLFSLLGVPIYYADLQAKALMNTKLVSQISEAFGKEAYVNNQLNRDFIAVEVFTHQSAIDKLNAIVHPAVMLDFEGWVKQQSNTTYIIKEAALLVETGSYKSLDRLIVVTSPKELRVRRIAKRDPFRSKLELDGILSKQSSDFEKVQFADFVVRNNEEELIISQVLSIDKKIRQHR